ncbi:MAG: hypothetical protein AAFY03_13630 [Pseudomonadota bacterium]
MNSAQPNRGGCFNGPPNQSLATVLRWRIKPGQESTYEDWLRELITAPANLDGFLGTDIIRPAMTGAHTSRSTAFVP